MSPLPRGRAPGSAADARHVCHEAVDRLSCSAYLVKGHPLLAPSWPKRRALGYTGSSHNFSLQISNRGFGIPEPLLTFT